MRISETSKTILRTFFKGDKPHYYVSELIKTTKLNPNAITRALKTLEKQNILLSFRQGKYRYYYINNGYQFLPELKQIVLERGTAPFAGKWMKALNRQTSYSFCTALCEASMKVVPRLYGVGVPNFWHDAVTFGVYWQRQDLTNLGKAIAKKLATNLNFAQQDVQNCHQACNNLLRFSRQLWQMPFRHKSNQELVHLGEQFYQYYLDVFPFVISPHAIENFLVKKIKEQVKNQEVLKILLEPVSLYDEEYWQALKLAAYAQKHGFDRHYEQLLTKHWQQFCWLPLWSIHAHPLPKKYFQNEIKNILKKDEDPEQELAKFQEQEKRKKATLKAALTKIKASAQLRQEVALLQEYINLRTARKNAISQAHYYHLPFFLILGKRLGFVSQETKLLSHRELLDGLSGKISLKQLKDKVKQRQQGWAILMFQGKIQTITGIKNIVATIEKFQIVDPQAFAEQAIRGQPANPGRAIGKAKIIKNLKELNKVKKGDILVTKMTTPDYMVAIHRASAIVTDEGGTTCHAAIVAREFNLPCIVGTKNATKILHDNDLVEVDAFSGQVRVLGGEGNIADTKIFSGQTIYPGKAKGPVRLILDRRDFGRVQSGDIIVAPQITPDFAPLLHQAAGFAVDEETLVSHAVLFGRALKIPSLKGTRFACRVLHNGEMVILDATKGLLKRLVEKGGEG